MAIALYPNHSHKNSRMPGTQIFCMNQSLSMVNKGRIIITAIPHGAVCSVYQTLSLLMGGAWFYEAVPPIMWDTHTCTCRVPVRCAVTCVVV